MKKAFTVMLEMIIISAIAFSFAGCRSTLQPSQKVIRGKTGSVVTLSLWHQWLGEDDPGFHSLESAVKGWNDKNPRIVIQLVGVNTEQYKIKIKSALAAGDAPDIFYLWGGSSLRPYILNNNILQLDSYLDKDTIGKLIPGKLDACMLNGKVYSLPMFTYAANLYCNKSLFEKAGAKIPATYSELLQAVKLFRAARITPIVVGEKDRWPGMYWFDIMAMREAGSQACLDALTNPSLFDQPDFLAATQKLCDLIHADAFNDDALSIGFEEMLDEFKAGKAAMIFQGNWVDVMSSAGNSVKGQIVEVPFPVIEGGKGSLSELLGGNVDGFCININVQHKKAAVDALKFICERAGKEGYLKGAGLPCWKMTGTDDSKAPALTKRSAVLMQSGNSFVEWWDTLLPAAGSEVHKALVAELFAGKKTPQEFIKEMTRMDGVTDVMIYNQY